MTKRMILLLAVLVVGGCTVNDSATTRPVSLRDRQEAALKNPMGYSPNMDNPNISGGGINELDKGALRRDVNSVLDP